MRTKQRARPTRKQFRAAIRKMRREGRIGSGGKPSLSHPFDGQRYIWEPGYGHPKTIQNVLPGGGGRRQA